MTRYGYALAGTLLALGIGCSLVTSYDDFQGGATGAAECGRGVPQRPAATVTGGDLDLVGVMSEARFYEVANRAPLGYDIDGLCTCPDRPACKSSLGPGKPCDPPGTGVDNAAGNLIKAVLPADPTQVLKGGTFGLVVRVKGWNGKPDDSDVEVSLYNAAGIASPTGGAPAFDGRDVATLDSAGIVAPAPNYGSAYVDTTAYVTGGTLVASFTKFSLRVVVPDLTDSGQGTKALAIPLVASQFVGKITNGGNGALVMPDAQLVGRMPLASIFEQIAKFGICADSSTFAGVKQAACAAVDVPVTPSADGTDATCDAVSFAFGVALVGGKIGGAAAATTTQSPCGPLPAVSCN